MSSRFLRVIFPLLAATVAAAPAAAQQMRGNYPQSYFRPAAPTPERLLMMQLKELDHEQPKGLPALTATACVGGDAGGYPCNNIDLL